MRVRIPPGAHREAHRDATTVPRFRSGFKTGRRGAFYGLSSVRGGAARWLPDRIGAAIFGHWGDRIGRKTTLIITLLVMGLASAAIGVLPGTDAIGVAAPLLLVTLRVLQGIAVGGEWSGSVLLTMEWGDQNRRGL